MGYFYLAAIKAVGYLGAAYLLKRIYHNDAHLNIWTVTLTRLLLGLTVGLVYGGLWILATRRREVGSSLTLYLWLLFPIRIVEWLLILWLFFRQVLNQADKVVLARHCGHVLVIRSRRFGHHGDGPYTRPDLDLVRST